MHLGRSLPQSGTHTRKLALNLLLARLKTFRHQGFWRVFMVNWGTESVGNLPTSMYINVITSIKTW
jgi:hypothetical protein